jgi:DNA (cytosine-5)-methyltransferase 1
MLYRAVDVMSFAGGFTLGMVQAGFELAGKRELPGGFGVANCETNRHLLGNTWRAEVGHASTWTTPEDVHVVFGNPPCSGWSVMSAKSFRGADSPALSCTWDFARYVARVKPIVAVFESVQQAFTHADGLPTMRALRDLVEEQTGDRYGLYHIRHNAYTVGGAAIRRRYFWLISRVPFGVEVPRLRHYPKFNDVIGDLAPLSETWYPQPYRAPAHPWVHHLQSPDGTVDGHIGLHNPFGMRLRELLHTVEWRPGESIDTVLRRCYQQRGELPKSFAHNTEKLVRTDFAMGFTTPTRWKGDQPARVITGGGMTQIIHPWLPRTITHRECARVLGFPDNWNIQPLRRVSQLSATWGKGITTHCGRWIGEWIKKSLDGNPGSVTGTPLGEREWDINCTNSWQEHARTSPHNTKIVTML